MTVRMSGTTSMASQWSRQANVPLATGGIAPATKEARAIPRLLPPPSANPLIFLGNKMVPRGFEILTGIESETESHAMNAIIYLVGLVVVILAILSFLGIN